MIETLPPDRFLESSPVLFWAVFVDCYRDGEDGYIEEVHVMPVAFDFLGEFELEEEDILGYSVDETAEDILQSRIWQDRGRTMIRCRADVRKKVEK